MWQLNTTASAIALLMSTSVGCASGFEDDLAVVESRIVEWVSDPSTPSETFLVRTFGEHRVRIERTCGSEHCGSMAFLEFLSGEFPRKVQHTVEIAEVAQGVTVFIDEVRPVEKSTPYAFDLYLAAPRNAIWRVTPVEGFRYKFDEVKPDRI